MLAKTRSAKLEAEKQAAMAAFGEERSRKGKYISGRYSNLADNLKRRSGGVIEAELLRKPEDIRDDTRYMGQTEVLLLNVPLHTVDERTPVNADSIREWVLYAISEEDPHAQSYFDEIQRLTETIGEIEGKLKKIPKIEFTNENGVPLKEEQAKEERNKLFEKYGADRTVAENALEEIDLQLKEHVAWRKTMGVHLTQGEIDRNSHSCTWHMTFSDAPDCQEIEDLLLMKENWTGIKLAAAHVDPDDDTKLIPAWAGRGTPPDGTNVIMPNYTKYHVNMLGVTVKRMPKGVGLFQQLDRKSASIAGPVFSVYYGEYELGVKHGYGVDTNDLGIYTGEFVKGRRQGKGRMDYADGTTVVGNFGLHMHNSLETKAFKNPYTQDENFGWEPDGEVEIFYSDGAYFKGTMRNGTVQGVGDYQSAFNEVQSGHFHHGRLHGDKGFHRTAAEDTYIGRFVHGDLHGLGTCETKEGDLYEGAFQHGLRHGRGVLTTNGYPDASLGGIYRGYYINDLKHGRGSLEYGLLEEARTFAQQMAEESDEDKKKAHDEDSEDEEVAGTGVHGKESVHLSTHDVRASKLRRKKKKASHKKKNSDEEADTEHILSPYGHMFQGFLMANAVMNQGSNMNTIQQIPTIISRIDKRRVYPIAQVLRRETRTQKRAERTLEKLQDMEITIRSAMAVKKARVFHQQKHFTKETMYNLDVYGEFNERELGQRAAAREERMRKLNFEKHPYKRALIPRLRNLNNALTTAYTQAYYNIRPDPKDVNPEDQVPDEFVKLALSNFEEARERQRLLKYDVIWQRAEDAFLNAKKGILPSTASGR